jgi:hypothetical protein
MQLTYYILLFYVLHRGEVSFSNMTSDRLWAKNPMCRRIERLNATIPLTLIYGSRSWIDHFPSEDIVKLRLPAIVDFHVSLIAIETETLSFSCVLLSYNSQPTNCKLLDCGCSSPCLCFTTSDI